ncbi:YopX family protein [Tissierella praeacuta]|uniref:YopX family protein n=1 Tax=Tissierella praeacuta TaxID=43131 RepID=UPI003DA5C7F5
MKYNVFSIINLFGSFNVKCGLIVGNVGPSGMDSYDLIIMQYTGLKDKNGKEIYEGDIVEFVDCQYESETLCVGEVIFEEFGWHFTNSITESSLSCYDSSEVKIIGNIYENKELLEVK